MTLELASLTALLKPEIQDFMRSHENSDIRELGLKKPPNPDWPYALILDQIKSRQKATIKLADWLTQDDVLLPPADIIEQASSMATARYKAGLVDGGHFVDLTGGAGVDSWALAKRFKSGTCVEKDPHAAALIAHNLPLLTNVQVDVHNQSAEEFITILPDCDLVYIDPQRRSGNKTGLYRLEDGMPDVTKLLPVLKSKTRRVMIKTAPMLDIAQVLSALDHVCAVHIVQWRGECKEILYLLDFETDIEARDVPITAVIIDDMGLVLNSLSFTKAQEDRNQSELSMPMKYLYEPGPALQKSGAFNTLGARYNLKKLHTHTHLYTGETLISEFPGRSFEIIDVMPVKRKALRLKKANLTIRNFPADVAELRKKLNLKDGGDDYVFACTLMDNQKSLVHCRKAVAVS